uniref:Kinesin-like protein n=2 Tax=Latimeria chalumnae TaxID=7897 RepID=H3AQU2_LATCH
PSGDHLGFGGVCQDLGKIRVFCRIRPFNKSEVARGSQCVVSHPDEYTITVESSRGLKEFQFDRVFSSTSSQENVFEDTSRLIQSAVDGYNVCIFAYGQTGSGKTFTMIGDKQQEAPGVVPRAFKQIFQIMEENKGRFSFKVSAYMLEMYNERLLDLFVAPSESLSKKLEVRKDKNGLVYVQGAETREVTSAEELFLMFQQGCTNRHIASTRMNAESSRSHFIIAIILESTNLTNGTVSYGKLSLVDLAGSERAAKTGATDEQLKEANSINKSLSALGDVISALSNEQPFVPYRNNKLTMLMQDSLGGNAKTLMFVNISPAEWNAEETVASLIYATRVKAITNSAQKNSQSKEIARLKEIIIQLKAGESVELDV